MKAKKSKAKFRLELELQDAVEALDKERDAHDVLARLHKGVLANYQTIVDLLRKSQSEACAWERKYRGMLRKQKR